MKTGGKRKTKPGPCKSPSPDIYNRSIIQNTKIQVDEIRSKMNQAQQKQIKYELESSYSQVVPSDINSSYQSKYRHLVEEFSRVKNQNKYLAEQNLLLNQENKRFSLKDQRSKTISQLTGALLSRTEKEPLKEKMSNLDQEKRRLENQLLFERDKNQQCQRNIDHLRRELLHMQEKVATSESKASLSTVHYHQYEGRLTQLSNSIISSFNESIKAKLDHLNSRINKVQLMEKILKEQHSRLIIEGRNNRTPIAGKHENREFLSTSGKAQYRSRQDTNSYQKFDHTIIPFNSGFSHETKHFFDESIEKLEQENSTLVDLLKSKNVEINELKEEKEKVRLTLQNLEREKYNSKPPTPKFSEKTEQNIFKKINFLQESARKANEQLERSLFKNDQLRKKLAELESHFVGQKKQMQNIIQSQRKKLTSYELQLNNAQRYAILMKKDEKIKRLSQINRDLTLELRNVNSMLQYIRQRFKINELTRILDQNYSLYQESQIQLTKSNQQYSKGMEAYRVKLSLKEDQCSALQKQLHLKNRQIQLLEAELKKAKDLNKQFHKHNLEIIKSNFPFMNLQKNQGKSFKFKQNHNLMLQHLKEGCQRLSILYEKVSNNIDWEGIQRKALQK